MDRIENPMISDRRILTADYTLWCHNPKCTQYGIEKVRTGFYETDTGWGEPDDPECHECGDELRSWKPRRLE